MGMYPTEEHLKAQQQGVADEDRPRRWNKLGVPKQEAAPDRPAGDDDDLGDEPRHAGVS